MDKCPYCGSENGVYTTYTGKQYYWWDGDPCGFNADVSDNQRVFARCISCNRKISLSRILREAEEERRSEMIALEDTVDLDAINKANGAAMRRVIDFVVGERRSDDC